MRLAPRSFPNISSIETTREEQKNLDKCKINYINNTSYIWRLDKCIDNLKTIKSKILIPQANDRTRAAETRKAFLLKQKEDQITLNRCSINGINNAKITNIKGLENCIGFLPNITTPHLIPKANYRIALANERKAFLLQQQKDQQTLEKCSIDKIENFTLVEALDGCITDLNNITTPALRKEAISMKNVAITKKHAVSAGQTKKSVELSSGAVVEITSDAKNSATNAGIFADNAGNFADNAEKSATDVTGHISDIRDSVGAASKSKNDANKSALSAEEARIQAELDAEAAKANYNNTAQAITGSAALSNSASGNIINQKENEDIEKSVGKLLDSVEGTDGFTNLKEGFPSESQDLLATILSQITNFVDRNIQATNKAVDIRSKMTHTELLAQDNNIVNNMLMDYLINEEEGTNVEKVYNKLSQDSTKKMRTIQMNNYKTKVYKEYIYLLKIIVLSIILLIPVLLLTKLELISKNMSLAIVVALIFIVILYLGYRLYILRMRDNINFDKVRMNFDRENAEMLKTKGTSMYEKKGPLSRLGITCIGDECCDENMVYDNLRHKCVLQENFGNFFEKLNDNLASDINIVKPNNLNENNADFTFVNNGTNNVKEAFVSRNNIQLTKEGLFLSSLNNSSQKQFQKNVVPSLLFE